MREVEDGGLLNVLNRLVTALEPPRFGDPILESGRRGVPERWEDKDYVYLQANLPAADGSEIDISIHGGLVFIRIVH